VLPTCAYRRFQASGNSEAELARVAANEVSDVDRQLEASAPKLLKTDHQSVRIENRAAARTAGPEQFHLDQPNVAARPQRDDVSLIQAERLPEP